MTNDIENQVETDPSDDDVDKLFNFLNVNQVNQIFLKLLTVQL